MRSRKGFTLIELMVVVLIVAVLAAVLVPMFTARLESARWSEGKAGAGTIATSIRAMVAEQGDAFENSTDVLDYCNAEDLYGKYFNSDCYTLSGVVLQTSGNYPVTYTIQIDAPDTVTGAPNGEAGGGTAASWNVDHWTLTHLGNWTRTMK